MKCFAFLLVLRIPFLNTKDGRAIFTDRHSCVISELLFYIGRTLPYAYDYRHVKSCRGRMLQRDSFESI